MSSQTLPTPIPLTRARDGILVREHLRGRDEAFRVLYKRYHKPLLGYCIKRVKCEALAEDLAQDVLIRALEHLDEFDTERPAWPWLKAIAGNVIVDHTRKHHREDLTPTPMKEDDAVEDDMAELLAERPLLREAMADLPDRQQVAIRLRYLEQWKSSEGADFLDLSRPAFEQLLFRARTNLRKRYERLADQASPRLAGALLPLYRLKEAVASRLRARFAGWEQTLHAMGPAAFDAIGQAATTVAVLGLVSGIVGGAASDEAPARFDGVPAGAVMPAVGYHADGGASAEAPAGVAASVAGPGAGESGAVSGRTVAVQAPRTGLVDGEPSADGEVGQQNAGTSIDGSVQGPVGPEFTITGPLVYVNCDHELADPICEPIQNEPAAGS